MQNKSATKLTLALLAATALSACNGGSSTASASNNAVQTNQLQQYIDSLSFTPAGSKQVTALGTRQQSFTTPGALTINSVDIKFYSGESCTGENVFTQTLSAGGTNPVTPAAGTYTSTNTSNNALCTTYVNGARSGCSGLYADMESGNMRSMQYVYNLANGQGGSSPIPSQCLYNSSAIVGSTTGVEGVANWTATNDAAACSGSGATSCGFSQAYSTNLTPEVIFFSTTTTNGNLGGVTGADAICSSDPQATTYGGTYKAYIADGTTRVACTTSNCSGGGTSEHVNWVLQPYTSYKLYFTATESATRQTTVNGIFSGDDLGTSDFPTPLVSGDLFRITQLTGLDADFISSTGHNCNNWTDGSAGSNARAGFIVDTLMPTPDPTPMAIKVFNVNTDGAGYSSCENTFKVMCVQQPPSLSITPQNLTLGIGVSQTFTATISPISDHPVDVTFTPTVTASTCLWNQSSFPSTSCISTTPPTAQTASCTIATGQTTCSVDYVTQGNLAGLGGGPNDITLSVSTTGYLGASTSVAINAPA